MAKDNLECSFCGRKKPETNLLIAGIDAHICDRCIAQANGIVAEETKQDQVNDLSEELTLKKPIEIKDFLDQIYHWSRPHQKGAVCSGVQPLQKTLTTGY